MGHRSAVRVLLLTVVVSAALVALLGWRYRTLRLAYSDLVDRATYPHPGIAVPAFGAVTLAGDTVYVGAPEEGTHQILAFLTSTCAYCRATVPAWNRIAAQEFPGRFLGIQLDTASAPAAYVAEHAVAYDVAYLGDRRLAELYRVRQVPLTLVVGSGGRVLYARRGVVDAETTVDSVLAVARRVVRGPGGAAPR